jgi:hypothetical protein
VGGGIAPVVLGRQEIRPAGRPAGRRSHRTFDTMNQVVPQWAVCATSGRKPEGDSTAGVWEPGS